MVEEVETVAENEGEESPALKEVVRQLEETLAGKEQELASLREQMALTVNKYRELALAVAPEVPAELVRGATVEEIEASLAGAREVVDRVKQQLESQRAQERVPTGAPPRVPVDLSGLSPREKIAYALTRGK